MNILSLACSFGGADVTVECPDTGSTYRFTVIVDRKRRPHIGGHFMAWGTVANFWAPYDVMETPGEIVPPKPGEGDDRYGCWHVLNLRRASRDPWFADLAGQITRYYLEN